MGHRPWSNPWSIRNPSVIRPQLHFHLLLQTDGQILFQLGGVVPGVGDFWNFYELFYSFLGYCVRDLGPLIAFPSLGATHCLSKPRGHSLLIQA